jgi:hypothetical protein
MPGERVEPDGFILPCGGRPDVALIPVAHIGDNRTTIVLWRIRKGSRSPRDRGEGTTKVWMGCSRRAANAAGQEREQQPVCGESCCDRARQVAENRPMNEARSAPQPTRSATRHHGCPRFRPGPVKPRRKYARFREKRALTRLLFQVRARMRLQSRCLDSEVERA